MPFVKGLSKEEVKILEELKGDMDAASWREFVLDLARVRASLKDTLPAKKRWKLATKTLTYLVALHSQSIKDEAGLEAYCKVSEKARLLIGKHRHF